MTPNVIDPTLDVHEVAAILRVSTQTVFKLCHSGALKFQRVGNRYRFKRAWVETFLDADHMAKRPRR
jgi:excisionase family DNA binding protein